MHVPLVDLRAQHEAIEPALSAAIDRVFKRGQFILGEEVEAFEQAFADYCGTRYAIGVASGLAALELALESLGIGRGDEVITAANTFVATALAIHNVGATPVLVDAHPRTFCLNPAQILTSISSRTRAILPVHLYGQAADMRAITQIARAYDLLIVEDACQAHGAAIAGHRVGSFGDAGCFSFYPTKNLGACGDGGMIVTDRTDVRDAARRLRNYGQSTKYISESAGRNERLDPIQAAILSVKLGQLDAYNAARRGNALRYDRLLADLPLERPHEEHSGSHVWHLYVIRTPCRDALAQYLAQRDVITGIHYPVPVSRQPMFAEYGFAGQPFAVTEQLTNEILSLPLYPEMRQEQIDYVCQAIHEFFASEPAANGAATKIAAV